MVFLGLSEGSLEAPRCCPGTSLWSSRVLSLGGAHQAVLVEGESGDFLLPVPGSSHVPSLPTHIEHLSCFGDSPQCNRQQLAQVTRWSTNSQETAWSPEAAFRVASVISSNHLLSVLNFFSLAHLLTRCSPPGAAVALLERTFSAPKWPVMPLSAQERSRALVVLDQPESRRRTVTALTHQNSAGHRGKVPCPSWCREDRGWEVGLDFTPGTRCSPAASSTGAGTRRSRGGGAAFPDFPGRIWLWCFLFPSLEMK